MKNKKKQTASRQYTIIALLAALLGFIATGLIAVVKGVIAFGLYTVQFPERLNNALWISVGVMVIGLASYAILEPGKIQHFFTGRQARYGGNTIITVLAFLGILIVGNVLAYQNPRPLLDLTEEQANTLAPEMLTAIETLPEPIHATAFFSQNQGTESAEKLLSNLKANSSGRFDYEFLDPDRNPALVQELGITGDGKVLLTMGERTEIAASATEDEILRAMIRLINPEERVVYFLTGHGESGTDQANEDNTAFTRAKTTLESKNYVIRTLNLLAENEVPEDADLIIIGGPAQPVTANEVRLLRNYLNGGGSIFVMENPVPLTDFGDSPDPLADMLLDDWGISLNSDVVIDLENADPGIAVGAYYDSVHPITRKMNALVTFFPLTRSLSLVNTVENVQVFPLIQTTERSWGETDITNPGFDEGVEVPGPMILLAAGENTSTGGRVVVFGTSQFASDQYFDSYGNGDLFANSVDWAAEQENLTNITPKQSIARTFLPASQGRILFLMFISACAIPGIFLALGIYTWVIRRRQG
ncbi:MAG TPA: Gldg family protein [Anaerolineales bacterium]|nr:Gldg family protein [Anaerolineales bacterium]